MKSCQLRTVFVAGLVVAMYGADTSGQSPLDRARQHCANAKAAAGQEHTALFERFAAFCGEQALSGHPAAAPPQRGRGTGGAPGGRQGAPAARQTPARETWYQEPVKVFDNLYFVGTKIHSSWAVSTSEPRAVRGDGASQASGVERGERPPRLGNDGLIVIDALFDYAVKDSVVDGLRKLGLNPATMKYLIISHGHGDHHGGAKFLQDEFRPRVILGGSDWDLVAKNPRDPGPKRDMVATDGQKITLGDTTLTLYLTPGHTEGTISVLIPVKDNGRPHLMATWGGTLLNAGMSAETLKKYADSASRYRSLIATLGVDGILSNHTEYDGSVFKLPALANRRPGDPHPYVVGTDSVRRYLTVVEEAARAALALKQ